MLGFRSLHEKVSLKNGLTALKFLSSLITENYVF